MTNFVKFHRHIAFTLAEVLIVLGIIGIIAEITIPALVQNVAKQQYVVMLQKGYIEIENAFKSYMSENGTTMLGDTDLFNGNTLFSDTSRQDTFDKFIKKYFKVLKVCRADTNDASCTGTYSWLNRPFTLTRFKNDPFMTMFNQYIFYTADGMEIGITLFNANNCTPDYSISGPMKVRCGYVIIDTNGSNKGPNIMGRDMHEEFEINYDGTLFAIWGNAYAIWNNPSAPTANYWRNLPAECGTPNNPTIPNNTNGRCIARIMENSWKMDY